MADLWIAARGSPARGWLDSKYVVATIMTARYVLGIMLPEESMVMKEESRLAIYSNPSPGTQIQKSARVIRPMPRRPYKSQIPVILDMNPTRPSDFPSYL
jgi:hypothetical protein